MLQIILSLLITISLTLTTSCARTKALSAPNSIAPIPVSKLSASEDPDGDGDNKGYGHFPSTEAATGNRVFIFDPNYNAWAAYDAEGKRVNVGRASGGSFYCPDIGRACKTIVGTFKIYSKKGAECKSSLYPLKTKGGAPMPYCMHFDGRGYAIHGSYDVPNHNASHGCIRVTPVAAKWLNESFIQIGTTVIVLPYESN